MSNVTMLALRKPEGGQTEVAERTSGYPQYLLFFNNLLISEIVARKFARKGLTIFDARKHKQTLPLASFYFTRIFPAQNGFEFSTIAANSRELSLHSFKLFGPADYRRISPRLTLAPSFVSTTFCAPSLAITLTE